MFSEGFFFSQCKSHTRTNVKHALFHCCVEWWKTKKTQRINRRSISVSSAWQICGLVKIKYPLGVDWDDTERCTDTHIHVTRSMHLIAN